jgi:superfamily II DNA/RNA helicase
LLTKNSSFLIIRPSISFFTQKIKKKANLIKYNKSIKGSGKTAAFLVPILNLIFYGKQIQDFRFMQATRRKKMLPLAIVLAPTRELASQIYDEARKVILNINLSKKNFREIGDENFDSAIRIYFS